MARLRDNLWGIFLPPLSHSQQKRSSAKQGMQEVIHTYWINKGAGIHLALLFSNCFLMDQVKVSYTPDPNSESSEGTSLVVQWLRIHLSMQGTQAQSLVQELRRHVLWSHWSHAPQHLSSHAATSEPIHPGDHALHQEKPPQWEARALQLESSPCSSQLEKARAQKRRPSAAQLINSKNYM